MRAEAARVELGEGRLVWWCAHVLSGEVTVTETGSNDPDPRWLAASAWSSWGPAESWPSRGIDYWPRVWAARTLLYVWHDDVSRAVVKGLADSHWRVREMCAKVVALHEIGEGAEECARIVFTDAKPRVRIAALRALAVVGESEHSDSVIAAESASCDSVAGQARETLCVMGERLDRDL